MWVTSGRHERRRQGRMAAPSQAGTRAASWPPRRSGGERSRGRGGEGGGGGGKGEWGGAATRGAAPHGRNNGPQRGTRAARGSRHRPRVAKVHAAAVAVTAAARHPPVAHFKVIIGTLGPGLCTYRQKRHQRGCPRPRRPPPDLVATLGSFHRAARGDHARHRVPRHRKRKAHTRQSHLPVARKGGHPTPGGPAGRHRGGAAARRRVLGTFQQPNHPARGEQASVGASRRLVHTSPHGGRPAGPTRPCPARTV